MEVRVRIVGADSIGVRSMACVVEAGGLKIFIDPGVSYAPRRYGLPPHPLEMARLEEVQSAVISELEDTDIVVVTHYHYDHYLYREEHAELYAGKQLFVKHPSSSINVSQRLRAHRFLKRYGVAERASRLEYADGRSFGLDRGLRLVFSEPVPHGPDGTPLGYVVMVLVECCGYRFAHASDVQGPLSGRALNVLVSWRPHLVFISGPPVYFGEDRLSERDIEEAFNNLRRLAAHVEEAIILDHHMARSIDYPRYKRELEESLEERGVRILSAAEFMGVPFEPLEAYRRRLWEETATSDRAS